MNFLNKARYFGLRKKDKILEIQNTSLYDENYSESMELLSYEIILSEQVFYETRFQYIDLIEDYFNGKLNCYSFQWDFFQLYNSHNDVVEKFMEDLDKTSFHSTITFSKDFKKVKFALLINELVPIFDSLDINLTEKGFDREIRKIYSSIKECIKSDSNHREALKFVMTFFTVFTFVAYSFLKTTIFGLF